MYSHLSNLRIVEGGSFIAAPICGLYLSQLGAKVIRFDQIGGGPDFGRWPKNERGHSLYWEGLNKGKKSIALDLRKPEGRELAVRLATAPGRGNGIFLTNYPVNGFLSHDNLVRRRPDQITVRVMGWADGGTALDYTINAAVGVPQMTGQPDDPRPVNHVLPAWDLLTGSLAALSLLAAERRRTETGAGEEVRVPLSDVAISTLGNLGQIAEVVTGGADRPRVGNDLFGAFGRDFETADGKRVMLVAITSRQWSGLLTALGIANDIAAIEADRSVSFANDEGIRYEHRDAINPIVERVVSGLSLVELGSALDNEGACWAPYRTLRQAVSEDPALVADNPLFSEIVHPSGSRYPTPGYAATIIGAARGDVEPAPSLGAHTEEVLTDVLGCSAREIAFLHDRGIVASAHTERGR
ncbi:CoA transferase [Mesorhizobium sp. L-8-10]|uniref:CoA transferase n=1 Tax=Mesorhizobium sp. L-8-10 TaxID=2744523 RepID=UPI00192889BD|nr:CoA transferase [Mesorhizobium sp. L-8-10]